MTKLYTGVPARYCAREDGLATKDELIVHLIMSVREFVDAGSYTAAINNAFHKDITPAETLLELEQICNSQWGRTDVGNHTVVKTKKSYNSETLALADLLPKEEFESLATEVLNGAMTVFAETVLTEAECQEEVESADKEVLIRLLNKYGLPPEYNQCYAADTVFEPRDVVDNTGTGVPTNWSVITTCRGCE